MALSDVTKTETQAPATETAKAGFASAEDFRKLGQQTRNAEKQSDAAYADKEGSKQGAIAFVCALGDPNRKQNRVEGENKNIPSYAVVGYKFKLLEDMTIPHAPLKQNCKTPVDVEPMTEVAHKAGDVVILNLVETGALLSRVEFAGKASGEGEVVALTVKISKDRPEPLPILKKVGEGSIKANMELIADMVGATDTEKGKPQIKAEFAEAFSVLYNRTKTASKQAGTPKAGEAAAEIAAAFRSFYGQKNA